MNHWSSQELCLLPHLPSCLLIFCFCENGQCPSPSPLQRLVQRAHRIGGGGNRMGIQGQDTARPERSATEPLHSLGGGKNRKHISYSHCLPHYNLLQATLKGYVGEERARVILPRVYECIKWWWNSAWAVGCPECATVVRRMGKHRLMRGKTSILILTFFSYLLVEYENFLKRFPPDVRAPWADISHLLPEHW